MWKFYLNFVSWVLDLLLNCSQKNGGWWFEKANIRNATQRYLVKCTHFQNYIKFVELKIEIQIRLEFD